MPVQMVRRRRMVVVVGVAVEGRGCVRWCVSRDARVFGGGGWEGRRVEDEVEGEIGVLVVG